MLIKKLCTLVARIGFWLKGYKIEGCIPKEIRKAVLVFAPHTSNWDGFYGLGTVLISKISIRFTAKKELMFFPLSYLLRKFGAMAIDRKAIRGKRSMVDVMVEMFGMHDDLFILIEPEGTRKYVERWKMGFYEIARRANVPIILTYIDYSTKTTGFGPVMYLTGNLEKDLEEIKSFYRNIRGRYPENGIR